MTLSTARFVPDRLGGPAELVRGGDRNNPTVNDGAVDVASGVMELRLPGHTDEGGRITGLQPYPETTRWAVEVVCSLADVGRTSTDRALWSEDIVEFRAEGARLGYRDAANYAYSGFTTYTDLGMSSGAHRRIRWEVDTVAETVTVYAAAPGADFGAPVNTETVAGWLPSRERTNVYSFNMGSHALNLWGAVRSLKVEDLANNLIRIDVDWERDNPDGESSGSGVGSAPFNWSMNTADGDRLKARWVKERNQAILDGSNDFWDLVGLDPWQVQGGGTVEVGFVLVVESIYELTASWGRLISTESENNRGLYLYAAPTGVANAGKLFCTLRSDTLAGSVTTPSRYDDIGRFAVAVRIGDVDGTRKISIRTNLEDWVENDLDTNVNDIAHGMPRIGSSAHLVSAGHPQSYSRCAVWDGNTAKTQAPSKADMSIALFEALEGAGKA